MPAFAIVIGGLWTLSSCSPPCGEGDPRNLEECEVAADAASSRGSGGGSRRFHGEELQGTTPQQSLLHLPNGDKFLWG